MKSFLVFQDGTTFEGKHIGAAHDSVGDAIFFTAMSGYQQAISDPACLDKIVVLSYPIAGGYGTNNHDDEHLPIAAKGVVLHECVEKASNFRMSYTLNDYLKKHALTGIQGVDTRALTKYLREGKQAACAIVVGDKIDAAKTKKLFESFACRDALSTLSVSKPASFAPDNATDDTPKIAVWDFGHRKSLITSLLKRGCKVSVLPYSSKATDFEKGGFSGVILSGGAGNPCEYPLVLKEINALTKTQTPVLGIDFGHLALAAAAGLKIIPLKASHRGNQQPVKDLKNNKTYITAQNHGFTVDTTSLKTDIAVVSYQNLSDGTIAGLKYAGANIESVQFHPECGGYETGFVLDDFITHCKGGN